MSSSFVFPDADAFGSDLQATQRAVNRLLGEHLAVTRYGAKGDAVELADGAMPVGDVLTSASASFGDVVGKTFVVVGALGSTVDPLVATCVARISATQVQLSAPATVAVTGATFVYGTNNTAAFNDALADALIRGRGSLLIPSGMWLVAGVLNVQSNLDIYGMGRSSVIYAANYTTGCAFYPQSKSRVSFRGLSFRSHGKVRSSQSTTAAIWARECQQVDVEAVYIDGSSSAGVFIDLCESAHVRNVEVRNTKADGVHIVGCVEAIVDGVRGYNTGDDTVSVVSYLSQAQAVKVNVSNVVSVNSRTRAVTVGGSKNVLVAHVLAIAPGAHGILVAYESGGANPAAELHTPANVTISHCRVENALGSLGPPEGFNSLLIAGDATHMVDDVLIQGCTIIGSNQAKILHARNVRLLGNEIRNGRFSAVLVEDCEDVETVNCKFKEIEGIGISYVRVTDGQISGNRLLNCQKTNEFGTNASEGRIHIVDSTDIYGFGNRDKRTVAGVASLGAINVSGGARVTVGVTEIRPTLVDVNHQIRGMEVNSIRSSGNYKDQLLLGTNVPVNVDRYAVVADRGMFVEEGDLHVEDGRFLGSGGAAYLDLMSGFAQMAGTSSARIWINRTDVNSNNTFFVTTGSGQVLLLSLRTSGELYVRGGVHPGNTSSGIGWYCYDGNPEGNVPAPIGSWCARNWSSFAAVGSDGPLYHKQSGGATANGWVVVTGLATEIPPVTGNGRRALRVNDGGTGYGWSKVPLDDPGAIAMTSIANARYLYHSTGGQMIGKGPADLWADIETIVASNLPANGTFIAAMKAALTHTHDYEDVSPGGTGSALSPPYDHSHTVSDITTTKATGGPVW